MQGDAGGASISCAACGPEITPAQSLPHQLGPGDPTALRSALRMGARRNASVRWLATHSFSSSTLKPYSDTRQRWVCEARVSAFPPRS